MEQEEKVRYGMLMFLSTLVYSHIDADYTTGLGGTLSDLSNIITLVILVLLGLVLIFIALDFLVAGIIPDKIIELLSWIYVLIIGVLIFLMAILNFLKI
jgi:hypothetical protein